MLGEISVEMERTYVELEELRDERNMFELANDETMPEFLFKKKLAEYDERIAHLQSHLDSLKNEQQNILDEEAADMGEHEIDDDGNVVDDEDHFEEEFEQLAHIDGVDTSEPLDDTAEREDLEADDRQARYDQYGEY